MENFNCICASSDENEFIFVGLNGKLVCVDADQTCVVDRVDLMDEKSNQSANIVKICSSKLRKSAYLVVSLSDAGTSHFFTQNLIKLLFLNIKTINNIKFIIFKDAVFLHLFVVNKFNAISFDIVRNYFKF